MIRIPASGDRLGVLMVNPGGPGASAVDTVAGMGVALAGTEIARSFDLVGFDPRGVGHSTPELRCRTDAEFDAYRREPNADYSQAGVAHIEDIYRSFAQKCLDRMGADFLANVGTASTAHDMDVVRAALGENQINYLGFSYGTELGSAYAEQYPDRVRAMVLDGAIDPTLDPIEENLRQMAGFQTAFEDYAADCAQSTGCPLGTDPTQFVNRYHQLVDPLVRQPAATSDPRGLSYQDAITGTRQRPLLAAVLEVPHQRAARAATQNRSGRPAAARRRLPEPRARPVTTRTQQDAFYGDPLRRLAVPDRSGRVGRRRPTKQAGGAVPRYGVVHRFRSP